MTSNYINMRYILCVLVFYTVWLSAAKAQQPDTAYNLNVTEAISYALKIKPMF